VPLSSDIIRRKASPNFERLPEEESGKSIEKI
jgi:hypothetical protein